MSFLQRKPQSHEEAQLLGAVANILFACAYKFIFNNTSHSTGIGWQHTALPEYAWHPCSKCCLADSRYYASSPLPRATGDLVDAASSMRAAARDHRNGRNAHLVTFFFCQESDKGVFFIQPEYSRPSEDGRVGQSVDIYEVPESLLPAFNHNNRKASFELLVRALYTDREYEDGHVGVEFITPEQLDDLMLLKKRSAMRRITTAQRTAGEAVLQS